MTAGEAVRHVVPEHVPYAEAFGLWKGALAPLREPLHETWKPYLDGRGSRDEALSAGETRQLHRAPVHQAFVIFDTLTPTRRWPGPDNRSRNGVLPP